MAERLRRVLIVGTGAIGSACAACFARQGASLALADVDRTALDSTARLADDRVIAKALVDLRSDAAESELARLCESLGSVDLALFTAGMSWCGDALSEDPAVFADLLRTSVLGLKRTASAAAPWLEKDRGLLVVVSGADARAPDRFVELWGVASACVQALTRCFAAELGGRGIRVANVAVHGVGGGGLDEVTHLLGEALGSEEAAERLLGAKRIVSPPTPNDVANAISALADVPLFGSTITLDGGATAKLV
jgi:NADP-dependent 3-hydroxy acid dehydrogenase YdfG